MLNYSKYFIKQIINNKNKILYNNIKPISSLLYINSYKYSNSNYFNNPKNKNFIKNLTNKNKNISDQLINNNNNSDELINDNDDNIIYLPINFEKDVKIEGQETQMLTLKLKPGQKIRGEVGSLIHMEDGIEMETTAKSGFNRFLTGGNIFITEFKNDSIDKESNITLGPNFPSKIIEINLDKYNGSFVCQKGAFLASENSVEIETEFVKNMTAGFFGGEGFILQKLTSNSKNAVAYIKAGGALITKDLKEGEKLKVTTGSLVGFAPTVQYDVETVKGIKNIMFGEGLFLSTLTGPGKVYLQSMPFDKLVGAIASQIPRSGGGIFMPMGMGGGGEGAEGAEGVEGGEGVESQEITEGDNSMNNLEGNDNMEDKFNQNNDNLYGDAINNNETGNNNFEEAKFEGAEFDSPNTDSNFDGDGLMDDMGNPVESIGDTEEIGSTLWDSIRSIWDD